MNRLDSRRSAPQTLPRRSAVAIGLGVLALGSGVVLAPPATAATLSVCSSGCAYSQIGPAVAAAKNGDTIRVGSGTYAGGFTISVSLKLVGAGASATTISGGGSVVTIGTYGATSEPNVSIDGVTITGGVARTSPESTPFAGQEGVFAAGGGIEIPPDADFGGGANVSLSNSVITGNLVAPTVALPVGPPCPHGPCPFAMAAGGGIDNWGTLTMANTTVSGNRVGSTSGLSTVASDADGGGIMNWLNPLSISNSVIKDNEAGATAPNGRFADSGGLMMDGGALTMTQSSVTNNSATLAASLPGSVDLLAIAGGVHITGNASATIRSTTISGNSASATNDAGPATAFSGGLHTDVDITLAGSTLADNTVSSATLAGSTGDAEGDSGAGEMSGTIQSTKFTRNGVTVRSAHGNAVASAGASIIAGTVSASSFASNQVTAQSPHASASVSGGGLLSGGALTVRNTSVSDNTATATGDAGSARGGGLFAAAAPNGPPAGPLTLVDSHITGNVLTAHGPLTIQGGGLYTTDPTTLTRTVIDSNQPDQCFGC